MKYSSKKILSLLVILSLFIGIVGAFNVDTTFAATKKIHLKKKTISVVAGKTFQQKLIDKKGKTIKASKVTWKSKKISVATINKKGKITAVKTGTAKMTAKYKGKTYTFTVKVKKNPDRADILNNLNYASKYGDYLNGDIADWIYCEYSDPIIYKDYLPAIEDDYQEILDWLIAAKGIADNKGYTIWSSKIKKLINDVYELSTERIDGFGFTLDDAHEYADRVKKLVNSIKSLYKEL